MRVRLLFFASYADAFGRSEEDRTLPGGATVGDLVEALRSELPARLPPSPLVAVNRRYAKQDVALAEGDEVALIPPVAGG